MMSLPKRLAIGFAAGALSHLLFQGPLGAVLYLVGLIQDQVISLAPIPPLGVPAVVNNMFWDGLWGTVFALLGPLLTARLGRVGGGAVFGFGPLLVTLFLVLPLKGMGVLSLPVDQLLRIVVFDIWFGVGTAVLFGIATGRPRSAHPSLQLP